MHAYMHTCMHAYIQCNTECFVLRAPYTRPSPVLRIPSHVYNITIRSVQCTAYDV